MINPKKNAGWVNNDLSECQQLTFSRVFFQLDMQFAITLVIRSDMKWHVLIEGHRKDSCVFCSLPSKSLKVSDVEAILHFINGCNICCGNDDEKFIRINNLKLTSIHMDTAGIILMSCIRVH